jgi:hypothetical protein
LPRASPSQRLRRIATPRQVGARNDMAVEGEEIAALPHSLCSGLRLTAMTLGDRGRGGCFVAGAPRNDTRVEGEGAYVSQFKTFFITSVRLSLVTRSVSTSGRRLISPAPNPLNSRDNLPIQGRGKKGRKKERAMAEGLMPFHGPLRCILGRIPGTPYQLRLLLS